MPIVFSVVHADLDVVEAIGELQRSRAPGDRAVRVLAVHAQRRHVRVGQAELAPGRELFEHGHGLRAGARRLRRSGRRDRRARRRAGAARSPSLQPIAERPVAVERLLERLDGLAAVVGAEGGSRAALEQLDALARAAARRRSAAPARTARPPRGARRPTPRVPRRRARSAAPRRRRRRPRRGARAARDRARRRAGRRAPRARRGAAPRGGAAPATPRSPCGRARGGRRRRSAVAVSMPEPRHSSRQASSSRRERLEQPELGLRLGRPRPRRAASWPSGSGARRGRGRRRGPSAGSRDRRRPAPRRRRTGCPPSCGRARRRRSPWGSASCATASGDSARELAAIDPPRRGQLAEHDPQRAAQVELVVAVGGDDEGGRRLRPSCASSRRTSSVASSAQCRSSSTRTVGARAHELAQQRRRDLVRPRAARRDVRELAAGLLGDVEQRAQRRAA